MKNLIKQIIKESIGKENQIEKIKNITLPSTIEGGFLNKQQAQDLQKEIEANYTDNLTQHFKKEKNDIRMHMFNYDQPIAEKNLNGINLRITTGLIRNKRITYLLYADGKIIGEFYSVNDIKMIVKYIEDNLIPNKSLEKLNEQVTKTKVICDNCGWSWNIKDGGKDKYVCHKCGHDNTPKKKLKELFDYENNPNKYIGDVINHHRDDSDNEIITIENDGYIMRLIITNHGGLSIKFDYKGMSKLTNKNEQYKVANFIIENLKKYINQNNITSITFSITDSNTKRFSIYEYALNKLNFFLERKIDNSYFFKKNLNEQKDILNEKCWKGYTQKGMKTMFGKRYPNCVKKIKEDDDYKIQHKAPSKNYGATMDRLTDIYPDDIYSSKALQNYGEGYPYDRLAIQIMQSAKDNPNKKIKIYRAVPKDVNTINSGDWVTTTMQYAKSHGKSVMNNDFKVISKIVPASTLHTDANSIHEWGYNA